MLKKSTLNAILIIIAFLICACNLDAESVKATPQNPPPELKPDNSDKENYVENLEHYKFDNSFCSEEMCAFSPDGNKVGYTSPDGKIIIEPRASGLNLQGPEIAYYFWNRYDTAFHDGLALFRTYDSEKFGFIDKKGTFIIPPTYDGAFPFQDGVALVMSESGDGNSWKLIDTNGDTMKDLPYFLIHRFSDGLAAVYDNKTEKWGYIDKTGNIVIEPKFGSFQNHEGMVTAAPFFDGATAVVLIEAEGSNADKEITKDGYALINKKGEIIKKYDYLQPSIDGTYYTKINDETVLINSKGEKVN